MKYLSGQDHGEGAEFTPDGVEDDAEGFQREDPVFFLVVVLSVVIPRSLRRGTSGVDCYSKFCLAVILP
jgi:hypothetical protein